MRQKPTRIRITGGLTWKATGLDPRIDAWIIQQMHRFGAGASHVIETAIAATAGINLEDELPVTPRRRALRIVRADHQRRVG